MTRSVLTFAWLAILLSGTAHGEPAPCPAPVSAGIGKAFPGATISACRRERDHGRTIFEVKLAQADGSRLEVDVAPDGAILQIEEPIAIAALPTAVARAFAAKYPRARPTAATRQTAGKTVRYEIGFVVDRARKEATFSAGGAFVEEE